MFNNQKIEELRTELDKLREYSKITYDALKGFKEGIDEIDIIKIRSDACWALHEIDKKGGVKERIDEIENDIKILFTQNEYQDKLIDSIIDFLKVKIQEQPARIVLTKKES